MTPPPPLPAPSGPRQILTPANPADRSAHARAEFPQERCGLLLADGGRRDRNVIDALHTADPDACEGTAATGYALGVEDARFPDEHFGTDGTVLTTGVREARPFAFEKSAFTELAPLTPENTAPGRPTG